MDPYRDGDVDGERVAVERHHFQEAEDSFFVILIPAPPEEGPDHEGYEQSVAEDGRCRDGHFAEVVAPMLAVSARLHVIGHVAHDGDAKHERRAHPKRTCKQTIKMHNEAESYGVRHIATQYRRGRERVG